MINTKQIIGIGLLFIMLITSFALFGGIAHKDTMQTIPTYNTSEDYNTPSIHVGNELNDVQLQASVDVGAIVIIIGLIAITLLGGVANASRE